MDFKINQETVKFNLVWLRENCRCKDCYDWASKQTKQNEIYPHIKLKRYSTSHGNLNIVWEDDHESIYDLNTILSHRRSEIKPKTILWDGFEIERTIPQAVSQNDNLDHEELKILVKSLLQFGVGVVQNVTPTLEATEKVVTNVGSVMHTFYGGMWQLITDDFDNYKDLAYTHCGIAAHTDNTYFVEPSGVQIFHCLQPAEKGGESILVDGFTAAHILRENNAEYYSCLKSTLVEWMYSSKEHQFIHAAPIINESPNAEDLEQIRYNSYHRSPRIPLTKNLNLFYAALKAYSDILRQPKSEWRFPMRPGTLIFTNNWRVLHGRTEFSGRRKLVGCYLTMNTLLNKARLLKVII